MPSREADDLAFNRTKQCLVCREDRPTGEYGRRRSTHDGLSNICNSCVRSLRDALGLPDVFVEHSHPRPW